jgi:multiple RNA-binding domain-containing protein 1
VQHHDQTFVDTSKIEVGVALPYGAKELPRPWSKFSEGSSGYKVRQAERLARKRNPQPGDKAARSARSAVDGGDEDQQQAKKTKKDQKEEGFLTEEQRKLAEMARLEMTDDKFNEFLEVMKGKKGRTWTNDGATGAAPSKKAAPAEKVSLFFFLSFFFSCCCLFFFRGV